MEKEIQKILLNITNDLSRYEIENLFTQNYDFDLLFQEIAKVIGFENNKIHFYVYFIESYSSKFNTFYNPGFVYLEYIIKNYSIIEYENINIYRYLGSFKPFLRQSILEKIFEIDNSNIDNNFKILFLEKYFNEYDYIFYLKNYSSFFRNHFLSIMNNDIFLLKKISLSIYKLCNYLSFSLSESIEVLYFLKNKGVSNNMISHQEIGYINHLENDFLIQEFNKLDTSKNIDFLYEYIPNLDIFHSEKIDFFNQEIRFISSLILGKKIFSTNENESFINYFFGFLIKNDKLLQHNFRYLINFLCIFDINCFNSREFIIYIIKSNDIILNTEINKIIDRNLNSFIKNNSLFIQELNKSNTNGNLSRSQANILYLLCKNLLNHEGLRELIYLLDNFQENYIQSMYFEMKDLFEKHIYQKSLKYLSYNDYEKLLFLGCLILRNYDLEKFLLFISSHSKGRYLIGKNISQIKKIVNNNIFIKKIKEKIFYSTIFPIKLYHYFKMLRE